MKGNNSSEIELINRKEIQSKEGNKSLERK